LKAVLAELDGFNGWLVVEVDQTPCASAPESLRLCMEWAREHADR
jgi:sugar phosphate isomerase/epimerase